MTYSMYATTTDDKLTNYFVFRNADDIVAWAEEKAAENIVSPEVSDIFCPVHTL